MSWYRQQLEDWLKQLDVKADTALDIGGKQNPVKGRTKSWNVGFYQIADLKSSEDDIRLDLNKIFFITSTDENLYAGKWDIIFCLETFEYLYDPRQAMETIAEFLKKGGKAYMTFAFAYPHHNELEMDSLRYTEPGIKRLAQAAGLRVTNIWYRRDRSGLLQQFYAADNMRAAKEYPDHSVTGFIVELTK